MSIKYFDKQKFDSLQELYDFCKDCLNATIDIDNHIVTLYDLENNPHTFKTKINLGGWYLEEIKQAVSAYV